MKPSDRARAEDTGWYDFLEGKSPGIRSRRCAMA